MSTSDPQPGATPSSTGSSSAGPDTTGPGSTAARPAEPRPTTTADRGLPEPQGPRTTGAGGHVLGVLVGFVLTLVALAVIMLGMSRILTANGVGDDAVTLDGPGVVLVTVGAAVAALVALLAVRTSAIPFTGGLVALVLGAAYLFAPEPTHRETVRLLATEQNSDAILSMLTLCLVGVPFVVGLVLLASGSAASLVRRRGIAVGAHRARQAGSR